MDVLLLVLLLLLLMGTLLASIIRLGYSSIDMCKLTTILYILGHSNGCSIIYDIHVYDTYYMSQSVIW